MDATVNYSEAKQEAERLSRTLSRDVEVVPVNCCNTTTSCGKCDNGLYYELRFVSCQHPVTDSDELCEKSDCAWREYQAFCKRTSESEAA